MTDFPQGFVAAIRLGNFRAFGGVQTIPFRPITLIYGPNGSGKSSIVEGIRWLRSLALSKSSQGFDRLVRHHDQTAAIQAGVTIKLQNDDAEDETGRSDYFARLARQIRSVSVDFTFGSKRTTRAQDFPMFHLGNSPHIQYLELKLNEIPLFRLSELEIVTDYFSGFSGFGRFSEETLGFDWFNWDHPIVDFLKAETLTLMRARMSEALGQLKQVQPESELAPIVRALLPRVETLLNEISAPSDGMFEIDTIDKALERLIFQSAGLFPRVELTVDDRGAYVFRSDQFWRHFPSFSEDSTPEIVADHFRIATACLVNAFYDLEDLNTGSNPLREASFIPAIRSVPTEDFILTDPRQRSKHAPDWLIKDTPPDHRVKAVEDQIRAINEWLLSLGRPDTNYEVYFRTERIIVPNVGSSPEEQASLNMEQVRFLGFKDRRSGSVVHLSETGTGFSQLIPVLFAAMSESDGPVCIQQPELHLHPALQSELGDLLLKSALQDRLDQNRGTNQLIIETHSEHILLRIMRRIRETSRQTLPSQIPPVHPDDVCILYVDPRDEGSIVRTMPLTEDGQLLYDWPGGFFEEGLRELLL